MNQKIFQGVNSNNVKEINRTILLRLMKKYEMCSRADLAKNSGLQPATVTNIVNDFIDWGLVKETGIINGNKGRRSIGLVLNAEDYVVLGVRITRTYTQIGMFDLVGNVLADTRISLDRMEGPQSALKKIVRKVNEMVNLDNGKKKLAIGVAVPGPYFPDEGKMHKLTEFPGWDDVSINEILCQSIDIPVIIDHDANAGAFAEWWISGNENFHGTTIYLAVGEGIGAGIVTNGGLFRGSYGTAGEIGHASIAFDGPKCECGNRGCLTMYASVLQMMRDIKEKRDDYPDTVLKEEFSFKDVVKAVKAQDELACAELKKISRYLAFGIINIICAYSPDEIIIGDQMSIFGDTLIEEIRKIVNQHTIARFSELTKIKTSELENDSAFLGAGALAIDYVLKNSSMFESKTKQV